LPSQWGQGSWSRQEQEQREEQEQEQEQEQEPTIEAIQKPIVAYLGSTTTFVQSLVECE
jgi:hypothetical protein